jgi:hypothetical protein
LLEHWRRSLLTKRRAHKIFSSSWILQRKSQNLPKSGNNFGIRVWTMCMR